MKRKPLFQPGNGSPFIKAYYEAKARARQLETSLDATARKQERHSQAPHQRR